MHDVTNRSRVDVEAVADNARALIALFAEVLAQMGHARAASMLPLQGRAEERESAYDESAVLAVTIAFHLMSLVEQRETQRHRTQAERRGECESGLFRSTLGPLAKQLEPAALERERRRDHETRAARHRERHRCRAADHGLAQP